MRVAIVGAGMAGLAAALELARAGCQVTVLEKEAVAGGLARSFQAQGETHERYYHFICVSDGPLLRLIDELGLRRTLHWRTGGMGQYYQGQLHAFGEPWDLLGFSPFTPLERLRFGWNILQVKRKPADGWREIAHLTAGEWLRQTFGSRAYEVIHEPLLRLKFGPHADRLSAAWIWSRFHRIGRSRGRFTQRERLGYLGGGMDSLVTRLVAEVSRAGGAVKLRAPVSRLEPLASGWRVWLTEETGEKVSLEADAVISTLPSAGLLQVLEAPADPYFDGLRRVEYLGVRCLLLKLDRSFSPYFWTNINDPEVPLAGVIELTRLNRGPTRRGTHLLYLPQYLPRGSAPYTCGAEELLETNLGYLRRIRPDFDRSWVKGWWELRDAYAQPICEVGFTGNTPDIRSSLKGLFVTDSCQLHPEDRTVANSLALGQRAAAAVRGLE